MKKIILILKGIFMGSCDLIPGVSGGTIALITGIYDELIDSLNAINLKNIKLLFKGKFKTFWKNINGNFLITLFVGIIIAIFTFANLIKYLMENHQIQIRSFFFGLIFASAIILLLAVKKIKRYYLLLFLIGTLVGFWITNLHIINVGGGYQTIFFSGFIGIIATILPGISGSYILLIIGQYQKILGYVSEITIGNWSAIIPILIFFVGAIIGLIFFSKILHYIKSKRYSQLMIILTGFMLGTLNKVRPWKNTIQTYIDSHGDSQALIQQNYFPSSKEELFKGVFYIFIGILLVILINYLSNTKKHKKKFISRIFGGKQ